MISISDKLLKNLVPELRKISFSNLSDLIARAQLEITNIENISGEIVYKLKPICDFRSFSGFWILAKELRISLKRSVELRENNLQVNEGLVKELFGRDLSSPLAQFLVKDCCEERPGIKDILEKFVDRNIKEVERPQSIVKLSTLLPIFEGLKNNWEDQVVLKLRANNWELVREKNDIWRICWPPWYSQQNLPPFSEILGRLLPLDQSSKPIRNCKSHLRSIDKLINVSWASTHWNLIRNHLIEKGFIECNTSKFIEKSKNLETQMYCLAYNRELTLRDNLHYSLIFDVLLKNFNNKKIMYPVFELSYCPWNNCWLLGLASVIELKDSKDTSNFWWEFDEIMELLTLIFKELLKQDLEFVSPERGEFFPPFSGALIYRLIVNQKSLGQIMIHRLEQFEIRKKELVSVSIKIPHFS